MHTLDLIILVVLAGGVVLGLRSGLIKQVASLVGLVLAFVLAMQYMYAVGDVAVQSLGVSESLSPLLGFVLVFLAVHVAIIAAVKIIEGLIGALRLSTVNRVLGGAMGGVKAALLLSVAFLVLSGIEIPDARARGASTFYDPVSSVAPQTWEFVTGELPQVRALPGQIGVPAPGADTDAPVDTLAPDTTAAPDTTGGDATPSP